MDMKAILEKTRSIRDAEDTQKRRTLAQGKKLELKKDATALTEEDIEKSLATIRSGLATVTEGPETA